ncbi:MAG TPA: hypothetical protein VD860_01885, partial [Azospirillum sp.]|nr:hypothetical protein [Azospirillum sp.]
AAPLDLTADNRLPTLCSRFLKIQARRKKAEDLESRVKAEIAVKLGSAPETIRAKAAGFNLTWAYVNGKNGPYRGGLTIKETFL